MKKSLNLLLITVLSSLSLTLAAHEGSHDNHISFVENKGQWSEEAFYCATIGGGWAWLEKDAFTFHFQNTDDKEKLHQLHHGKVSMLEYKGIRNHVYQLQFLGSSSAVQISGAHRSSTFHNYFLGDDPSKWASNVPLFYEVNYNSIYPGINMRVGSAEGYFKYDFIVSPGADANQIQWKYKDVKSELKNGKIIISSHAGEIVEYIPEAYQMVNGFKKIIPCEYVLKDGTLSFKFPKGYNKNLQLIIDPTLIFSSFTGSTADNWGFTATYDNLGNLYSGSVAFGAGYPTTVGAFDNTFNGGTTDVAISKFSPTGATLLYSTYLGGSNSEAPHSLIVNANNELMIFGTTGSSNFPTTAGCFDNTFNGGANVTVNGIAYSAGSDIFVAKFNAAGNALLASTFIGGTSNDGFNSAATLNFNYADQMRGEINFDGAGNIYVASTTQSGNFPTTPGSLSTTLSGTHDGCAFKFNSTLGALGWSTFIGGSNTDAAYSIKVASNGSVYIGGGTRSTNFPVTAGSLITSAPGGNADGYIINLNGNNGSNIAATYIGTNNYDQVYLLEIDDDNDVYVAGQTKGAYPVSGGVFSTPNGRQFIHKLNPTLNSTAYSTVFGSGSGTDINISVTAFLVDECENVYVSGWGGNTNNEGSTAGLPVTPDAYDATTDGSDFYFFVLERNGANQLYGSFFGGSSAEHVDGGTSRFDPNGTIYQAVCAACGGGNTFPTTPGVWSTTNGSTNCNLGAIKMSFVYTGIVADANAAPNIIACDPPFNVNFTGSSAAVNNIWNFGDGVGTSTLQNPTYTFTDTGTFTIIYIAIDSSTCNIADTAYLTVQILQSEVFDVVFDIPPFDPCQGGTLNVNFEFTGSGADSLVWNMGDGTFYYNDTIVTHGYSTQGTFIVSMTAYDFTCNRVETFTDTIIINSTAVTANANAAPNIITCDPPFTVNFTGGTTPNHFWDFGDGSGTSTQANPNYTFTDTGSFTIMYVAIDSSTCNIADTVYLSVQILQPKEFDASLSTSPVPPCTDSVFLAITFTGVGADSLIWNMGNGTFFYNDTAVNYIYTVPGSYTLTMTAFDLLCNKSETITQTVTVTEATLNSPILVPNVFSPNNDGINKEFVVFYSLYPGLDPLPDLDVYEVEVYNRWGLKMFDTKDGVAKWNGTYNGKLVDEGVYYYIVKYQRKCWDTEVTVVNGHVTVLR